MTADLTFCVGEGIYRVLHPGCSINAVVGLACWLPQLQCGGLGRRRLHLWPGLGSATDGEVGDDQEPIPTNKVHQRSPNARIRRYGASVLRSRCNKMMHNIAFPCGMASSLGVPSYATMGHLARDPKSDVL